MSGRRVDPDWIFQLPSAAVILREATAGRLRVLRTGFGVNPNDGIFNCALIAHFSSPKFFKWLRTESRLNWESAPGAASLEFIKLDDRRLDEWVDRREIDPSSIFALDLARQYAADLPTRAIKPSTTTMSFGAQIVRSHGTDGTVMRQFRSCRVKGTGLHAHLPP